MTLDFGSNLRKTLDRSKPGLGPKGGEKLFLKPGERRNIAVLYLDLSGFTALSEKLDHEVVHEIAKSIMDALVEVTEEYEGYVDKIEGDRIMVLFGAKKSGENDSIRAISCGFRMLEAIRTANDILMETGVPITARIGINSGPVTVAPDAIGHLTAMGKTVNLASRMEEAAPTNTILVPDSVRVKCDDMICWKDMGSIAIKGIVAPVHTWQPTGPGVRLRARWDRTTRISSSNFVGRSIELAMLEGKQAIQEAGGSDRNRLGGAKHIVFGIKGDAGIGKSRLVHEFLRVHCTDSDDVLVLKSQALPYAQPPYWLWTSILRSFLGIESERKLKYSEFKDLLVPYSDDELLNSAPFLAEQLSIHSEDKRLTDLDSGSIALETIMAFRNLIKVLSRNKRILLILDDLHWMDSTCKRVLEFIVANCESECPILFFLLYRPERADGDAVEFDIKSSYAELEEIFLPEMTQPESNELVGMFLSGISENDTGTVSQDVLRFMYKHAVGNPYFIEELVLDMTESDILRESCSGWDFTDAVSEVYIPSSLSGLLQSRLDRLPDQWKGALQKSSVLGIEFKLKLYNRLIKELSLDEKCRTVFNNLERRRFIIGKGSAFEQRYMFRNVLIHDTAYNSILSSNRKVLHRIAAQIIEEMYSEEEHETAGMLAHHWERAEIIDEAVKWGIRNLSFSVANYQHETTLKLCEKLERWLGEDCQDRETTEKLLGVLHRKNETLEMLGRRKEQEELLVRMQDIARKEGLSGWSGKILSALGTVYRITGRLEEADKCYREALDLLRGAEDRESEGIALGSMGILARIRGNLKESAERFHDTLEIYRELGDRRREGVVLGNLGNLELDQDRIEEAINYYQMALEIYREVGDRRSEGIALGNLGNPYRTLGRTTEALDLFQRALRLHREIGNRRSEGITLGNQGILHFQLNQLEEALSCYQSALEIHREIGNRRLEAITLESLAMLHLKNGCMSDALECYQGSLSIIEDLKLSLKEFDSFEELYRSLLASDHLETEIRWPSNWGNSIPDNS